MPQEENYTGWPSDTMQQHTFVVFGNILLPAISVKLFVPMPNKSAGFPCSKAAQPQGSNTCVRNPVWGS